MMRSAAKKAVQCFSVAITFLAVASLAAPQSSATALPVGSTTATLGAGAIRLATSAAHPAPIPARIGVYAYYTEDYSGDTHSLIDVEQHAKLISDVIPFSYTIDGAGNVSGTDPTINAFASTHHLAEEALVNNFDGNQFQGSTLHEVFSSSTASERAISSLVSLAKRAPYTGIHLDFENVAATDRSLLTSFVRSLADKLHAAGKTLSMALPAKASDEPSNAWVGAYDFSALGAALDKCVVMTYDEYWAGGDAGPIAALPWVSQVMNYVVSVIPPSKVLMGVAAYGYDWRSPGVAAAVPESQYQTLAKTHHAAPVWNTADEESHFSYTASGINHTVWCETPGGLAQKITLAKQLGLAGIAIWRAGYTNAAYWNVISLYGRRA